MACRSSTIDVSDDFTTESESDHDSALASSSNPTQLEKRKLQVEILDKVDWTEDEDDVTFEAFQRRKRQKAKAPRNSKGKGPATTAAARKQRGKGKAQRKGATSPNPEEYLPEKLLPQYLQSRRQTFDQDCEALKEAGLRLAPDYSDLQFSEHEELEKLEEKPQFDPLSGVHPCRAYEDIQIKGTLGVIPASIAQYLRDYQIEGVEFLHELFVYQKGGILGDDMGLGKTVQVAAFLTAAYGKTGDKRDAKRMRKFRRMTERWYPRTLIICPGSLTQNWKNELNRWGWWNTDLYHGSGKEDVLDSARAGRIEIMITTYTTYKNNRDQINSVPWDVVVADECHSIKDVKAEVTQAMNEVNALCRIGLTGTAIQNRYEELWTLLNWTNPGVLGTMSEWKHTICKPLTIGQSHDATKQQLSTGRKTAKMLKENLLPRFFLRRMKSLIAHQLPKKSDKVVFCPLSEIQRQAYENLVTSPLVGFVKMAHEVCECGSGNKRGFCCHMVNANGDTWKALVFPIVMSLQKLSNHLTLLIPQHTEASAKQTRDLKYLQAAAPDNWHSLYNNRDSLLSLADPKYCGKWVVLKKLLEFWHGSSNKVLVFSHSVRLLRILQHLFGNTAYSVSYLDGSLSYEERQQTVDDFNSDPNQFVFLISTKAGGVGLNITSANKVVIMDPHWNPAYDLQAQDRAYRIGQVRDVDVYRLISAGTIEEITYARQIYKQQQANIGYNASNERRYFKGVQQDKERKGEIFGLGNLLAFHGDQIVLREIVNKTNIAEAKAGVNLVDIDMEKAVADDDTQVIKQEQDADDGNGGLSQLAAMLTKDEKDKRPVSVIGVKSKRKSDAIQAILASAGVEYTHENSEVVGSSKIEDRLSRQAQLEGSQDAGPIGRAVFDNEDEGAGTTSTNFRYNPPEDVMQRQFCTMAKTFGFPNATEFALTVESMTQEERRNCLDTFYKKRLDHLEQPDNARSEDDEATNGFLEDAKARMEQNKAARQAGQGSPLHGGPLDKEQAKMPSPNRDTQIKGETPSGTSDRALPSTSTWLLDDDDTDEL
ncbi:SNF2 superfamily RAD26-like protein [Apiospora rasikravindrae]|uniref:SNF2 superfamily RAD26-like protein n=1 Tax=Apiospora rasikravindrae TaxID=990691 RepID=A0ABR1T6K5_9PEZI